MDLVKFGIIGCGNAATFHTLGMKKESKPNMKYVAAYDINEKNLSQIARRAKLTPYNDLDKFLQSDIDAVLITVPHFLHESITKVVAEAGKHVLCEKPMAPTLEECDKMIEYTTKANVKLMIAENHRFLPAHQYIKKLLEKDFIGNVFFARTYEGAYVPVQTFLDPNNWQFTYDKGGGGVVADQGVHKFSMLDWFLGEVHSAFCWCGKSVNSPSNKGEDTAIVLLRYKNGAMVSVELSSVTIHPLNNTTELQGTKGTIYEDHSWNNPIKILSSHPEAEIKGEFYNPRDPIEHGSYPHYYTISARCEDKYFAECIINDKEPEFTPKDAKEAVAVVLLSYYSMKKGTTVTMEEFREFAKRKNTRDLIDISDMIQKNYNNLKW